MFLNKQDVLKAKIESGKCIGNYFPGYLSYELSPKGSFPALTLETPWPLQDRRLMIVTFHVLDGNKKESDEYLRTRCFIRDMFIVSSYQSVYEKYLIFYKVISNSLSYHS